MVKGKQILRCNRCWQPGWLQPLGQSMKFVQTEESVLVRNGLQGNSLSTAVTRQPLPKIKPKPLFLKMTETEMQCKHCKTTGSGTFCAVCGQALHTKRISLHSILHEAFHFFTHLDHGFPYT